MSRSATTELRREELEAVLDDFLGVMLGHWAKVKKVLIDLCEEGRRNIRNCGEGPQKCLLDAESFDERFMRMMAQQKAAWIYDVKSIQQDCQEKKSPRLEGAREWVATRMTRRVKQDFGVDPSVRWEEMKGRSTSNHWM